MALKLQNEEVLALMMTAAALSVCAMLPWLELIA